MTLCYLSTDKHTQTSWGTIRSLYRRMPTSQLEAIGVNTHRVFIDMLMNRSTLTSLYTVMYSVRGTAEGFVLSYPLKSLLS